MDSESQNDSTIHPILTLPPEITSEIFVHCLPTPAERERDVVNTAEAPLLLTHICREWRQIAISTPALWTTFEAVDAISISQLAEITNTWFERAGECPVSAEIDLTRDHDLIIVEILQRHSTKMCSLELELGENLERMDLRFRGFVRLRQLSIRSFEWDVEDFLVNIFTNAPLLQEVSLSGISPFFVALPWQQFTKFTGDKYTVTHCVEALRLMPHLSECAFSTFATDRTDLEVSHPNIQHLTMFGSSYTTFWGLPIDSGDVLELLTLPALRMLEMRGVSFSHAAIDNFLLRSSPPLQKLSVRPLKKSVGGTQLLLSPAFTTLRLTDLEVYYPAKSFISSFFNLFSGDAHFLPQLRKLSFLGCRAAEDEAALLDIISVAGAPISARRQLEGCVQLQSFRVEAAFPGFYLESMFRPEVLQPFKDLKALGMEIYIGTDTRTHSVI
ncbi:hypothetical protein B0H19DRAFT_1147755 [Mycena capillaripes]|nr:hypothetical protein B0H19DRAFT_1147755 [Mycena capillaripes]